MILRLDRTGAFEMTEDILEQLQQENNFQEEPTEEEIEQNFSTIESNTEKIFQDNQEDYEGQFQDWGIETVPQPFATLQEIKEENKIEETSSDEDEKKN